MTETNGIIHGKDCQDYGSGVTRPKINNGTHFKLKGQFLKELRDNTFSGSEHKDANKHIEKVLEIVDLFHIPNVTQDQIMLRGFPVSLTRAASRWLRNEPACSILTWEVLKSKRLILFYNGLDDPTRQILDSKGTIKNQKQPMEESLTKFIAELAKRHEENSIKEIRASTDAAIRNQGASIKTLEISDWTDEQSLTRKRI
ncbi:hypothetical protein Tco_1244929 [Tanacetum coccineum]